MWNFTRKNDYPNISLHDCRIVKLSIENKDILLNFDDNGFWIIENNVCNPYKKTLRTDKSQIIFRNCDLEYTRIYIYEDVHFFKKVWFTKRNELSVEQFISKLNNGTWQFEVIDERYNYNSVEFTGWIWFKKKPYHMECQILLCYEEMNYFWNKICEDRPW